MYVSTLTSTLAQIHEFTRREKRGGEGLMRVAWPIPDRNCGTRTGMLYKKGGCFTTYGTAVLETETSRLLLDDARIFGRAHRAPQPPKGWLSQRVYAALLIAQGICGAHAEHNQ